MLPVISSSQLFPPYEVLSKQQHSTESFRFGPMNKNRAPEQNKIKKIQQAPKLSSSTPHPPLPSHPPLHGKMPGSHECLARRCLIHWTTCWELTDRRNNLLGVEWFTEYLIPSVIVSVNPLCLASITLWPGIVLHFFFISILALKLFQLEQTVRVRLNAPVRPHTSRLLKEWTIRQINK